MYFFRIIFFLCITNFQRINYIYATDPKIRPVLKKIYFELNKKKSVNRAWNLYVPLWVYVSDLWPTADVSWNVKRIRFIKTEKFPSADFILSRAKIYKFEPLALFFLKYYEKDLNASFSWFKPHTHGQTCCLVERL